LKVLAASDRVNSIAALALSERTQDFSEARYVKHSGGRIHPAGCIEDQIENQIDLLSVLDPQHGFIWTCIVSHVVKMTATQLLCWFYGLIQAKHIVFAIIASAAHVVTVWGSQSSWTCSQACLILTGRVWLDELGGHPD
jgi:hypothetical protein